MSPLLRVTAFAPNTAPGEKTPGEREGPSLLETPTAGVSPDTNTLPSFLAGRDAFKTKKVNIKLDTKPHSKKTHEVIQHLQQTTGQALSHLRSGPHRAEAVWFSSTPTRCCDPAAGARCELHSELCSLQFVAFPKAPSRVNLSPCLCSERSPCRARYMLAPTSASATSDSDQRQQTDRQRPW